MRKFFVVCLVLLGLNLLVRLAGQNEEPISRAATQSSPSPSTTSDLSQYEEIPRSSSDPCRYFLVEATPTGNSVRVIAAQDCPTWGTSFTEREYDCENRRTRYLGDNGSSPETIQLVSPPDPWTRLIPGSSAADTAALVCGRSETNDRSSAGLGVSRNGIQARLSTLDLDWSFEETEPLLDGQARMFVSSENPMILVELIGEPGNLKSVSVITSPSDDPDHNALSGIVIASVLAELTSEAETAALLDWYTKAVSGAEVTVTRVFGGRRLTVTRHLETLGTISLNIEPA